LTGFPNFLSIDDASLPIGFEALARDNRRGETANVQQRSASSRHVLGLSSLRAGPLCRPGRRRPVSLCFEGIHA
jgi:hypothetical protein